VHFCVYFLLVVVILVVSAGAIDCLERVVSEMNHYCVEWDAKL